MSTAIVGPPARRRRLDGLHHPRVPLVFGSLVLFPPLFLAQGRVSAALGLVYLLLLLSSAKLTSFVIRPRPDWMELTFWVFVYVFLVAAPVAQISRQDFRLLDVIGHRLSPDTVERGVLIAILGAVSFIAGTRLVRPSPSSSTHSVKLKPHRTRILGWSGVVVGLLFLAAQGPGAVLQARYDSASVLALGDGAAIGGLVPFTILRIPTTVALVLLFGHVMGGGSRRRDRVALVVLFVFVAFVNNPISTPRFYVGTIILAILYTWSRSRPGLIRYIGPMVILALLVLFPYMDGFRRSTTFAYDLRSPDLVTPLLAGEYNMLPLLAASGDYVDIEGHSMGRQLTATALFWVPRSAWPTKPNDTGDVVFDGLGAPSNQYNVSAVLWEELYVDFGYVGVCLGFVAYGAMSRNIDLRSRVRGTWWYYLAPIVAGYQVFLLRGSLLPAVPKLLIIVIVASACFALIRSVRYLGPAPVTERSVRAR